MATTRSLVLLTLTLLAGAVDASPVPDFPFLIVTEHVQRNVPPAHATVNVTLLTFDETSAGALAELDRARRAVFAALADHGLPPETVTASRVQKEARRANRNDAYRLEILGYEVDQTLSVRIEDLEVFGPLLTRIIATDNVSHVWAEFEPADPEGLEAELVAEVGAAARRSADAAAAAQDRRVAGAYGITDRQDFGSAMTSFRLSADSSSVYAALDYARSAEPILLNVPDHIEVGRSVTVLYELADAEGPESLSPPSAAAP